MGVRGTSGDTRKHPHPHPRETHTGPRGWLNPGGPRGVTASSSGGPGFGPPRLCRAGDGGGRTLLFSIWGPGGGVAALPKASTGASPVTRPRGLVTWLRGALGLLAEQTEAWVGTSPPVRCWPEHPSSSAYSGGSASLPPAHSVPRGAALPLPDLTALRQATSLPERCPPCVISSWLSFLHAGHSSASFRSVPLLHLLTCSTGPASPPPAP